MNYQLLKYTILSIILFCLTSCKVDVYFSSEFVKENEVLLNGKYNLADYTQDTEYSVIEINSGTFEVSINGKEREVYTRQGGMLNLNEEEFVIYPLIYSSISYQRYNGFGFPIVVDSTVYYRRNTLMGEISAEQIDKEKEIKRGYVPYDLRIARTFKTGVIRSTDFFAEKGWDFDINEDPPEKISIRTNSNSGRTGELKSKLLSSKSFKILTLVSDEFVSADLRSSN